MDEKGALGQELWNVIEESQGYAFISDSCIYFTNEQAIQRAKDALQWEIRAANVLRKFLRTYAHPKESEPE